MEKCELPKYDRHEMNKSWENGAKTLLTQLPQTFKLFKQKKKQKKNQQYLQSTVKQGMRVFEIQFSCIEMVKILNNMSTMSAMYKHISISLLKKK